jgi:recombination protein RecA
MAAAKKKRASRAAVLMAEINHELGTNVMLGSDPYFTIERIPTGSLVMDRITGGGFALGRHYELFGDENSGKSYIVYRTMALSQQRGNVCAVIDPEHSFDNERFAFLGGDNNEILSFHPKTAEDAVAVLMLLGKHAKEREIEVVGIDSVASLIPREEFQNDPREEDRMAAQARMMSRALRRLTAVNEKMLFLWTNQERENIGIRFGNPKTTSGGRALRFYATGRIEFRRGTKVMAKRRRIRAEKPVETEVAVGRWTQVKVEKDKSTIPGREGAFIFHYGMKTIDPASEILQLGLEDGLIERSGNVFSYEDIDGKKWSGLRSKFANFIYENDELREELISAIEDATENGGGGDSTEN